MQYILLYNYIMVRFEILKKEEAIIWAKYNKLRKQKGLHCPAFDENIIFTLQGWRHLIGATGHKKRTSDGKYRRLKLFPYVDEIITKSATIQDIRESNTHKDYALEAMISVEYDGKVELSKIRVIVREDKKGNKAFHSVMDRRKNRRKSSRKAPHTLVKER